MNKLQQAYIDLGLQPGAPLERVVERWRVVARMWHPDRAATEQEKVIAEAELKKVNGARDLIARHYQDGLHKLVGCECATVESAGPAPSQNYPPPPPPSPSSAGTSAAGQQTKANGSRRKRKPEPVPQAMAAVLTAAMVLLAMSIVRMNSGVQLRQETRSYDGGSPVTSANWPAARLAGEVSPSTIMALRPSPANAAAASQQQQQEERSEAERSRIEQKKDQQKSKPAAPQLPPNTSYIMFVSSDGRLVNLQDGTTWALWSQEPAESFFHWQKGDRIVVKGVESSPCWLVNESRSFQAVQVTRVE